MELQEIVERYAEALKWVDGLTKLFRCNKRGEPYPPALKTLTEGQAVAEANRFWQVQHPDDFVDPEVRRLRVPYADLPGAVCDHVFTTVDGELPEWAIEVKNIALVGINGKDNGYGVTKVLSPYLKDRSMLHDIARLRHYRLARRHAVIGYAFSYDETTCAEALVKHPEAEETVEAIRAVCKRNGGSMTTRPLLDFAESILGMRGYLRGPRAQAEFTAWRHPAGGRGLVFGWEIRRPELEPDYDPRHPW